MVWRVRWWVRVLSVAVLVLMVMLQTVWATAPNPDWQRTGVPLEDQIWGGGFVVALALVVWSAFRARIELADGMVRVVNPWGVREFPASDVVSVHPGGYGLEFELPEGRVAVAFAVQSTAVHAGAEPRWVEIARAVTGREPEAGSTG